MNNTLNRLDLVLQQVCPAVMAPRYEPLQELEQESHRFLVAQDGLYLDVLRPWLQLRLRISTAPMPLPYGPISEKATFNLGNNFTDLFGRFVSAARASLPKEHAAWFSFDTAQQFLHYEPVTISSHSVGHITYNRPVISEGFRLAVDIHSHGHDKAFFSPQDDKDDVDDTKLAIVVGHLHQEQISVVARLVLPGGLTLDYTDFIRSLLRE